MAYVVITLVVLIVLNIYCSNMCHKLFYQSKESSLIEKCLLASDEIATAEVLIHGLERGDLDWRDIVHPQN